MDYSQTLAYLQSALPMFHRVGPAAYKANLDNTYALMHLLDTPHQKIKCIHIAGTNGKGSTSNMLASILQEAGYKTGLYTSPHLKDFRERIRVNGDMAKKEWIANFVTNYKEDFDKIQPSFFEMTTAMAFAYFAEMNTDINIIETGLGGRLDSTNVINPIVSIITNIGYDHMNLLGDTLPKIATEKAGIIKHNTPVIISESQTDITDIFENKANDVNAPILFADKEWEIQDKHSSDFDTSMQVDAINKSTNKHFSFNCELTGPYQTKNIAGVLACIDELKKHHFSISDLNIQSGMQNIKHNTGFKGRWYKLQDNPLVMCDTAHNKDGLQQVLPLVKNYSKGKIRIVLGMVDDKDITSILPLFPTTAQYYFCKAEIPRGLDANILKEKANAVGLHGNVYTSVQDALNNAINDSATNDFIFVGGSTFTVAEIID
ncbi:MAG: bifunctional folylpolyglutamate synthase/dihydrofolate synthase [Bacteroidota bacterium]